MSAAIIRRTELEKATLNLGTVSIQLSDYVTSGLRIVCAGPSGIGKTNAGLLIAEQLSEQGWVSVLIDPEREIEALYGPAVDGPSELADRLAARDTPILVVRARDASEFLPYGEALLEAADQHRKPLMVMLDEAQLFSHSKSRKGDIGAAGDLVNDFAQRGRKRALDLCVTALRLSNSLHRAVFSGANLMLIGQQQDPSAWTGLAPKFRGTGLGFNDLAGLALGEFFVFSRRGVDKSRLPMATQLEKVAIKAKAVRPSLPTTFSQWNRAMRAIPPERLARLTDPVVTLLSTVAGISPKQIAAGREAIRDEQESRGGA